MYYDILDYICLNFIIINNNIDLYIYFLMKLLLEYIFNKSFQ